MNENMSETLRTVPKRPVSAVNRAACLVHIYPTGPGMGARYSLGDKTLLIGRGEDCQIHIVDHSVSRRHARILPGKDGYYAEDLNSTNGTFVNDTQVPATSCKLNDGDYLRVGNCIYRFLAGGNVEAEYHEEIYRLTIFDALTETHNKRYLLEFLERELARSARHERPLALLMADIDLFKSVNDSLGHLGGDYVLRELAGCVKKHIRREDLFARYGGEEFALVLVETDQDGATRVAEHLRELIAMHEFRYEEKLMAVTLSFGIACTQGDAEMSPTELIRLADEKLYQAKTQGRNRVVS